MRIDATFPMTKGNSEVAVTASRRAHLVRVSVPLPPQSYALPSCFRRLSRAATVGRHVIYATLIFDMDERYTHEDELCRC